MSRHANRFYLLFLVLLLAGFGLSRFFLDPHIEKTAPPAAEAGPAEPQLYLLIGGSNMGGMAELPEEAGEVIEGVQLLNTQNKWEPAQSPLNRFSTLLPEPLEKKLGPSHTFARRTVEHQPGSTIRLIVNAGDDSEIEAWFGKSQLYWGARGRTRKAPGNHNLTGVIWIPGAADLKTPEGYQNKLATLLSNLRSDFQNPDLPFIVSQCPGAPRLNAEIAKFVANTPGTGATKANGLSTNDGVHLDTESQLLLGERLSEKMIKVRASLPKKVNPPDDLAFIDPHVHAHAVTPLGLHQVAAWMKDRNVEQCIVSPLNHKGSRAWTEKEREIMLANFQPYKGRIHRMCIIDAGEVETVDKAVAILTREKKTGAVGFGEHYGRDMPFDDPRNLLLYEACEKVGLPVMFHIDQNKNTVTSGMPEVDRVLSKHPNCILVAHAYWWRQFANGTCDRQLQEHPNLYADLSGRILPNIFSRDPDYAREFIIRNQDKILWATDEGWWSFGKRDKQMQQHYNFLERLNLPDEVRQKIYRENALKVYGLNRDRR